MSTTAIFLGGPWGMRLMVMEDPPPPIFYVHKMEPLGSLDPSSAATTAVRTDRIPYYRVRVSDGKAFYVTDSETSIVLAFDALLEKLK